MALQDTALALIEKFGENRTVVLQVPNMAPADPTKPWDVNPTGSVGTVSAPAVVIPVKRNLVNGNSVQQGDEQVLIAGLSLGTTVPSTADRILDQGQEKNIIAIDRIRPGKTDFLWKLQVRAS
jgi:hypothetical protein